MAYRLAGQVLEGGILAFAKSLSGSTPALPDGFVECNGQSLTDAQSVYNTKTMPLLNSLTVPKFLKGSETQVSSAFTSGTTGGTTGHTHCVNGFCEYAPFPRIDDEMWWEYLYLPNTATHLPSYYEVVYVVAVRRSRVPVGAILPFLKGLTGVTTLPDEYVECNGQTITDSQSPYSIAVPNLNGASSATKLFLRGSSVQSGGLFISGTTGGAETHTHIRSANRACAGGLLVCSAYCPVYLVNYKSNLPRYYQVVFVMRIK